jgi:hypothetical protein
VELAAGLAVTGTAASGLPRCGWRAARQSMRWYNAACGVFLFGLLHGLHVSAVDECWAECTGRWSRCTMAVGCVITTNCLEHMLMHRCLGVRWLTFLKCLSYSHGKSYAQQQPRVPTNHLSCRSYADLISKQLENIHAGAHRFPPTTCRDKFIGSKA